MEHVHAPRRPAWLVWGLLGLGITARLVPHPWNATPTMAIALFAGVHLQKRWALWLPLAIVAASDVVLGWHETIPFTWGAFLLTGALAWWIRASPTAGRLFAGALAGSAVFFLLSNVGVWLVGGLYPRTAAGLWECYVAAIPFFRSTLAGDLVYTAALFGGYAMASGARAVRSPVR